MSDGPWCEVYRPNKIDDCILPENMKKKFKSFLRKPESIPHLLLTGTSGVGKTTVAKALINELDGDCIVINASKDRNIDVLRTKILDYASTVSFSGGRKCVILDEADYLNITSTQPALRNFMEEYASNCLFILTCNYENKIMVELKSRCSVIEFKIKKEDKKDMIQQSLKRFEDILLKENVEYDRKVLLQHILNFFPDLRKGLNELQSYSNVNNVIDSGILSISTGKEIDFLMNTLKEKNFTEMRKWVAENDLNMENLVDSIYRKSFNFFPNEAIPAIVSILADYDYKDAFVSNKEINIVAMLTDIMSQT